MTTFIDTSVIFSARKGNEKFSGWSKSALQNADRPLIVSDMVFSELSAGARKIQEVFEIIKYFHAERVSPSEQALFLAGQAFRQYKENMGKREKVPSDLLIGAHANSEECPLITTNPKDIQAYFPTLSLVTPDELSR